MADDYRSPFDPLGWGVADGKIVREIAGGIEEVPALEIVSKLQERVRKAPEKSITDRAIELLFHWIAVGVRPVGIQSDDEQLPREAVRWIRALEAEVATPTKRPEEKNPLRAARRQQTEEEEEY